MIRTALAVCCVGLCFAAPAQARFDSGRTWRLVEKQLAYGHRPAGSAQLRALAEKLRPLLPNGHFEAVPEEPGLRNIVGTIPGRRPGIVIGAHYDTLADPPEAVGANNAAAGTAMVLELARALAADKPPPGAREIRFVLFDGEEPASGLPEQQTDFYNSGLRGSRAYIRAHRKRTAALVLLDWVGGKGVQLPREANSTSWLWERLRRASRAVGTSAVFPAASGPGFLDDHAPFLRAGIPAIDLIDANYKQGHTADDTVDKLSRASLLAVGRTVLRLAQTLRTSSRL